MRFFGSTTVVFVVCLLGAMAANASVQRFFIHEYRVKGARQLTRTEIEAAVYPYLGPGRSAEDVDQARAALEAAFQSKGYQTVAVRIPPQEWQDGAIVLEVSEMPVGRLRVHGARYFLPSHIKAQAPSLAEGTVLNFNDVNRDVVTLNQHSDQQVTPSLRPGVTEGTVDIDLQVKDTFPLHGSLEFNNRQSANTTPLRLAGSISYDNLWQWGHSVEGSFQLSPQDPSEVLVFSGSYMARVPHLNWLSLQIHGTYQDSAVSTVGNLAVAGRGETIGLQSFLTLPGGKVFSQALSLGFDYKRNQDDIAAGDTSGSSTNSYYYFPFSVMYSASWMAKAHQTELAIGPTFSFRDFGSDPETFESSRYGADGNFIYLRGSLAHTRQMRHGFEVYAKVQGQVASKPLVSPEQYGGGGLGTVRGYLEGEVFGDNAVFGTVELRSPSLHTLLGNKVSEWRLYLFAEGGLLTLWDTLPEQESQFDLAGVGVGSQIRFFKYFHASLDLGVPLVNQTETSAYHPRLTFRLRADM